MFCTTHIFGSSRNLAPGADTGNPVQVQYKITHHYPTSGAVNTWLTVPALLKVENGRLCLEVAGRENHTNTTRNLHFQRYAASQIRESLNLGTVNRPVTPDLTEISIDMHTGTAVFHFNNTAYLLHTATNVAPSLKNFIRNALEPEVINKLSTPSDRPDPARLNRLNSPAPAGQQWLGTENLATEVMVDNVQPQMTLGAVATTSRTTVANHQLMQPPLNRWEAMAFAGTKVIHDDDGRQVFGENGMPARSHPPVFDQNQEPVFDRHGRQVFRHGLDVPGYRHYFQVPPDQCPIMHDRNNQPVHDATGTPVREMPRLNTAFFTDALNEIVSRPSTPSQKQAALSTLATEFLRSRPDGYVWTYRMVGGRMRVTLPPALQAALTSEHVEIRHWALERLVDVADVYTRANPPLAPLIYPSLAHRLCMTENGHHAALDGYAPAQTSTTHATFGERHQSMFLCPNGRVWNLANAVTGQIGAAHGFNTSIQSLNNGNDVHAFRPPTAAELGLARDEDPGPVTRVHVPAAYDFWIAAHNFSDQRRSIELLSGIMHAYTTDPAQIPLAPVHIPPDHHARGMAQYLVRNLAGMPEDQIERVLYSDALLQSHQNFYSNLRGPFIEELRKPGPTGATIPDDIVNNLSTRMRTVARNDWALQHFRANVNMAQFSRRANFHAGQELIRFANSRNIDLVDLVDLVGIIGSQRAPQDTVRVQAGQQQQQQLLQDLSDVYRDRGNNQADIAQTMANTRQFMAWLRVNLDPANAPG